MSDEEIQHRLIKIEKIFMKIIAMTPNPECAKHQKVVDLCDEGTAELMLISKYIIPRVMKGNALDGKM